MLESNEKIWESRNGTDNCVYAPLNVHIHLGDGQFLGSHAGRTTLRDDTNYIVRVRFHDSAGEISAFSTRPFKTYPANGPGVPSDNPWVVKQPGYVVQRVATGLQLPVNIEFVPNPGPNPTDPFLYVTELYGTVKVMLRNGTLQDYATNLLNFNPTGNFPGSGEMGVTGVTVDPVSGDVFASLVYQDPGGSFYDEVLRMHSNDGGHTAATMTKILDSKPDQTGASHQISNLTVGPDLKLYVHMGDGDIQGNAQNLDSYLGKILRINLDGSVPADNPFYDASNGITARDRIIAYGLRNPFGGDWRAANNSHYEVENGPSNNDRLARVWPNPSLNGASRNFGFDGSDESMRTGALYNWSPPHAPTNLAFVQPQTFGGSGFPAGQMDHAFVAESGPTFAAGPQSLGKRISELDPDPNTGEFGASAAHPLIEYDGVGYGTVVGLAAGPDGLYFTDLYKDDTTPSDPTARGANIWRVSYPASGSATPATPGVSGEPDSAASNKAALLAAAKKQCRKKHRGKRARKRCLKRAKKKIDALP